MISYIARLVYRKVMQCEFLHLFVGKNVKIYIKLDECHFHCYDKTILQAMERDTHAQKNLFTAFKLEKYHFGTDAAFALWRQAGGKNLYDESARNRVL